MSVIHITVKQVWLVSVIVLLSLFFRAVITSKWDMKEIIIDCYPWRIFILPVHFYIWHNSEWEGGHAVGWGSVLQARGLWVRFPMVSLEIFIVTILSATHGLGVDSTSNRNEYQEYFLGSKGGQCPGLTTYMCWEPQPPGTLRACQEDCFTIAFTSRSGKPG